MRLRAEVFFLEIQTKDPTDQFLLRFADIEKPVRKKSLSAYEKNVVGHVIDKKTKQLGVIFDQGAIHWSGDSVVEVEGGYDCGSLCTAAGVYRVERKTNQWVVTEFKASVIS